MEISELVAYAKKKYHIEEQHKWADFPGFSVLAHPQTGKWIALLMRQRDTDSGTEIERCDLKCGNRYFFISEKSWITAPIRMRGKNWIGISFDCDTEAEMVYHLFDLAVSSGEQRGFTIMLDSLPSPSDIVHQETPLPFSESTYQPKREIFPKQLRQMRRLYEYGPESKTEKAKHFYLQGKFMENFEDDSVWEGDFFCYYPTYQDLTTRQLRGYFSWRTRIRRGEYQQIPCSAAYIYIFELLNGIGTVSPEDTLQKMKAFKAGYLDTGYGDARMRQNLRRWILEYAIMQDLPPETARSYADPKTLERDAALQVLRNPENYEDKDVFAALCVFGEKRLSQSPVISAEPDRGKHLFSEAWRIASTGYHINDRDLFSLCFGERVVQSWYPLSNAVYYRRRQPEDRDYDLNECRSYQCRSGVWKTEGYDKLYFDKHRFRSLLHETDARLRRYLKTGRYLRETPQSQWAAPYIETVIQADQQAVKEAQRSKVHIDLTGLEKIRKDAVETRDSLLTEEERMEEETRSEQIAAAVPETDLPDIPLNVSQLQILRVLLEGKDAGEIIRENRLMPSIAADEINEALFEWIGDIIVICEDDKLLLMDDYKEELEQILGGT